MTPQQARTITDFLCANFENEIGTTARVIEAVPADKLSYSPDAKSKNGLALIRHITVIDAWFLNSIADGKFEGGTSDESDACGITNGADGGAKYKKTVAAALARVRALPDEKLAAELDFFGMMKMPAAGMLALAEKHSVHHRGQLSAYLRAMGGKVPGIYGPSGDSQ
jgi:uncharacterized damage-inducible protein DinB